MRKVKLLAGGMMLCIPLALIGVSASKGDWVALGVEPRNYGVSCDPHLD